MEVPIISLSKSHTRLAVYFSTCLNIIKTKDFSTLFCISNQSLSQISFYEDSDIVFLVGSADKPSSSQRFITVFNCSEESIICELVFSQTVRAIESNLTRLVVMLDSQLHVLKTDNFKTVALVSDLSNPLFLISLSQNLDCCLLAFANSQERGYVEIFDCFEGESLQVFSCHKSLVSSLKTSPSGKQIATASVKGTIIRLFDCLTGDLIKEFRRGLSEARIFQLSFMNESEFLVSSSTGTIHLFDARQAEDGFLLSSVFSKEQNLVRSKFKLKLSETSNLKFWVFFIEGQVGVVNASLDYFIYTLGKKGFDRSKEGKISLNMNLIQIEDIIN